MSYIDSFSHSHVGNFLSTALYHPMVTLDDDCFNATPQQLVWGGGGSYGGGEAPSIVIQYPAYAVFQFFLFKLDGIYVPAGYSQQDEKQLQIKSFIDMLEHHIDTQYPDMDSKYNLIHDIGFDRIANIVKRINKYFKYSKKLGHTEQSRILFVEKSKISPEAKLNIMLGEIIYYYCPEFLTEHEKELLHKVFTSGLLTYDTLFYNAFQPAVENWNSAGIVVYKDNLNSSTVVKYNVPYYQEHQYKDCIVYQPK